MTQTKALPTAIPLGEMERIAREDLSRTNQAIAEINRQLAEVNQKRHNLSAPALTNGDPVEQARAEIEAEKQIQDLAIQERALGITLQRYNEQAARMRQELAQIQQQIDTSAAQSLIDDVNGELLTIADEISKLRDRQRRLLVRAVKLANQQAVGKALTVLGVRGGYLDLWLADRQASSFDAPNLGKMAVGMAFVSGDALKDHPSSQGWVIVSQSVFGTRDVK